MGDAGGGNMAHWAGLYGGGATAPAEATVVVTAAAGTTVSSPTSGGSGGSPTRPSGGGTRQPRIEGARRIGKPAARRRSRASRRAPVTLLNTDTSNFRAMVQQLTGVPFGPPYGPAGGPLISFGAAGECGAPSSSSLPVRPSPVVSFDHQLAASSSQHRPPSLQGQLLFRPQPQQQYGYDGGDMSFLHGFESSSAAEDRMLLQSIQAAQMMPGSRPASSNNTGGYNFG